MVRMQIEPKPMTASIRDVAIDTALYDSRNATLNDHAGKRGWPNDFQVCKGSAWMILSRPFCQYLINGGEFSAVLSYCPSVGRRLFKKAK